MSIEQAVKDVITQKLGEGIIEKLVAENLEKGINKSLENLLGGYGDITKVIEKKIKEVMIDQLSSYDYSKYIVKLDYVLTEIFKRTSLDNKKILENFKELMVENEIPEVVKVSDIFEKFEEHVAADVSTDDLEVIIEDGPSYECVPVTMEVEYENERSWSSVKYAKIVLECEKDEKLNCEIRLHKFENRPWRIDFNADIPINSLRTLDTFDIYLLRLKQAYPTIEIDEERLEDEVEPEAEPEASFS
jgi:hypothetical protein